MPGSIILSFPRGLAVPARFDFSGGWPFSSGKPAAFGIDWLDRNGNIPLHFNPRPEERRIVLNSLLWQGGNEHWGQALSVPYDAADLEPHEPFRISFDVLPDRFAISLDGRQLCEFAHRMPQADIAEVRSTTFLWRLEQPGRAIAPEVDSSPLARHQHYFAAERNPRPPERLSAFRLYAVLSAWMEEDVVAATVANCFRQGCQRVYLVDNGSSDRTVARALGAGAILGRSYSSDSFVEEEKVRQMQAVVDEVSAGERADHIWWLWVDADEFPRGPGGKSVREHLAGLDRRFRIVGARFFNHLPNAEPAYLEGSDPLASQPLCYEIPVPNCALGHFKHPLQRWDRAGPPIVCGGGAHTASCSAPLVEPTVPVLFHHFPYRDEAVTRRRLERLFGVGDSADRAAVDKVTTSHMRLRMRSLDAVYRQRWDEVVWFPPCVPGYAPALINSHRWLTR